ncbi:AAA+-type ATPase [Pelomyxa schiedti]|nr:AAA+-type ATPase [Pelomyxa schiedti]
MAGIASKWFGEGEKYVKAVFTLASKIAPSVIFIDEVDSILGKRQHHEHEAMRKIKNEFMSMWDGLRTKQTERVLVLAATNRPFDLDDAVLRRLNRRLLVDLPNAQNRSKILKVILQGEDLEPGFDINAIASMTEGFSGSDLKNLCVMAAYQPIREILKQERALKSSNETSPDGTTNPTASSTPTSDSTLTPVHTTTTTTTPCTSTPTSQPPTLKSVTSTPTTTASSTQRPLTISDFEKTLKVVTSSVNQDAASLTDLHKWNDMYGDNRSNKHGQLLSYFV